jgi:hypothetical protein
MPIDPISTISLIVKTKGRCMGVKLGSIVMVLMIFFIAKISFETAMAEKNPEVTTMSNERSPASIDRSYYDHLNKR